MPPPVTKALRLSPFANLDNVHGLLFYVVYSICVPKVIRFHLSSFICVSGNARWPLGLYCLDVGSQHYFRDIFRFMHCSWVFPGTCVHSTWPNSKNCHNTSAHTKWLEIQFRELSDNWLAAVNVAVFIFLAIDSVVMFNSTNGILCSIIEIIWQPVINTHTHTTARITLYRISIDSLRVYFRFECNKSIVCALSLDNTTNTFTHTHTEHKSYRNRM